MPLIGSKGVFSACGYGFGLTFKPIVAIPGTQGIFSSTANANTTKYNYTNDTVGPGTAFTQNTDGNGPTFGGAFGTTTYGLFSNGSPSTIGAVNTVQKYTWTGAMVSTGTALNNVVVGGHACGNSTTGFVNLGGTLAATNLYTYSGETVATGPSTTAGTSTRGITFGNASVAITNTGTTVTNIYTYSAATIGGSTALNRTGVLAAATGTSDVAFIGGGNSTATSKWTYSGSTCVVSTSTASTSAGSACGNSVFAIMARGAGTTTTSKYVYSSAAVSSTVVLTYPMSSGEALSNGVTGVNM